MTCLLEQNLDGPNRVELYSRSSPQQDLWVFVERSVTTDMMKAKFIVTIEAAIRNEQDGDVSVDDVKVNNCD